MCGIVAAARITSTSAIERGLHAIAHRGPDAHGIERLDDIALGHVRLSILDTSSASNQPFRYGDTTVVFNGEIWNYVELRRSLEQHGHRFVTSGDVEVLAAVLDTHGEAGLSLLEGMFGIAWTKDGELWAARDRFGEVPLHVSPATRMVASEMKALVAAGCPARETHWVRPGEIVQLSPSFERRAWYELDPVPFAGRAAALERLRSVIQKGCTERTISDVPICMLLSGGIDSSSIALYASELIPDLVAYTAVFDPSSEDLTAAREVAAHLGIELREVKIEAPSPDDLLRTALQIEMPFVGQVQMGWACFKLAETMRADGFKVTLSGEGSDELWASYDFSPRHMRRVGWNRYRKELLYRMHFRNFARSNKAFMAHSVESRMPFLSTDVVEFAMGVPKRAARGLRRPKALMQDAFAELLPKHVTTRKKIPFQTGLGIHQAVKDAVDQPQRFLWQGLRERYPGFRPGSDQLEPVEVGVGEGAGVTATRAL